MTRSFIQGRNVTFFPSLPLCLASPGAPTAIFAARLRFGRNPGSGPSSSSSVHVLWSAPRLPGPEWAPPPHDRIINYIQKYYNCGHVVYCKYIIHEFVLYCMVVIPCYGNEIFSGLAGWNGAISAGESLDIQRGYFRKFISDRFVLPRRSPRFAPSRVGCKRCVSRKRRLSWFPLLKFPRGRLGI